MNNRLALTSTIKGIVSRVSGFPPEDIREDDDIRDELLIDSLKLMEIIARTEVEFDISLDEADLLEIDSIEGLADLVSRILRQTG